MCIEKFKITIKHIHLSLSIYILKKYDIISNPPPLPGNRFTKTLRIANTSLRWWPFQSCGG